MMGGSLHRALHWCRDAHARLGENGGFCRCKKRAPPNGEAVVATMETSKLVPLLDFPKQFTGNHEGDADLA
jgi:hypothetical protein